MTVNSVATAWASDVVFETLGSSYRVRSTDLEFGAIIDQLTQDFVPSDSAPEATFSVIRVGHQYQLFDNDRVLVARGNRGKVLMRLLPALNSAAIKSVGAFAVHAGAVARGGDVVAFPGRSGTGKSTITAACLQQGFGYVTDEALIIEPTSEAVVPYPKALWLSPRTRRLLGVTDDDLVTIVDEKRKAPVLATALGSRAAVPPLRLTHLVLLKPSDGPPHLEELDPGVTAHALLLNAFNRYQQPEVWFRLVAELARSVRVWRLKYRDPREAAEMISAALQ